MPRCSDHSLHVLALLVRQRALAWSFAALLSANAAMAQPNVLVIIADDLNRMISPLGDPNAITPNLERLATRSVCFENATCQFPFCSPSRASLFMGLYPWNHGNQGGGSPYPNPHSIFPDRVGLPEYFRSNGYWTASYGKTEHRYQARNWDLQTTDYRTSAWSANLDPAALVHSATIRARGITGAPTVHVYDHPPNQFVDGVSTTVAIEHLSSHLSEPDPAPFFVVIGYDEPHDPWTVPKQIFDQYNPAALTLSNATRGNWPGWAWKVNHKEMDLITEEQRRDIFHAYLSAVTLMDHQLGRILDFLDAGSLWDDTIVVFLSDNGFSLCEHEAMYAKRNITRENISVPLLIHTPVGGAEGQVCARQVELQDLFPTLIDLCDLPAYPGYLDGNSIRPLLEAPDSPWPHVAKAVIAGPLATYPTAKVAQYGSLKLAQGGDTVRNMYFDHATDPSELFASWHPFNEPPGDPKWQPLLTCLNDDLTFGVGQSYVFYSHNSTYAPDRDRDGCPDSAELALAPLGFSPWTPQPEKWHRLRRGPVLQLDNNGHGTVRLAFPGLTINRPPGYNFVTSPFEILESRDLDNWTPSEVLYHEDAAGNFFWSFTLEAAPARFFRIPIPQS